MNREKLIHAFMPWAGLTIGLLAMILVHQIGSEGMFNDCRSVSPGPLLVVALLGLLACGAAGLGSWRAMHGSDSGATRRVIGAISVGCAALFAFAMLFPMIASLVLPPCFQ